MIIWQNYYILIIYQLRVSYQGIEQGVVPYSTMPAGNIFTFNELSPANVTK